MAESGRFRRDRKITHKKVNTEKRGKDAEGPSDNATTFGGAIMPIERVRGTDTFVRLLVDSVTVSATAGGIYSTVFSSDPTTMTQWANMSGNVDQYRVLAMEWLYVPVNRNNQTLSVGYGAGVGPFYTVLDYNSVVALTSAQVAVEFASCELTTAAEKIHRVIRATGLDLMAWVDTNNVPTRLMGIKTYSLDNFASIKMGYSLIRRLIQFRSTV